MATGISLKTSQTTYECTLEAIKDMIADRLDVDVKNVTVDYVIQEVGGDPLDRYPGRNEVTKICVTVKN